MWPYSNCTSWSNAGGIGAVKSSVEVRGVMGTDCSASLDAGAIYMVSSVVRIYDSFFHWVSGVRKTCSVRLCVYNSLLCLFFFCDQVLYWAAVLEGPVRTYLLILQSENISLTTCGAQTVVESMAVSCKADTLGEPYQVSLGLFECFNCSRRKDTLTLSYSLSVFFFFFFFFL